MHTEALERWELLCDASRHQVLPVTLAEEMSVTETIDLLERLGTMGLAVEAIVVNKLLPPLFPSGDAEILADLEIGDAAGECIAAGRTRIGWQRVQSEQLARLRRSVSLKQVLLPHMLVSAAGPEVVHDLSLALEALLAPRPIPDLVTRSGTHSIEP